MCRCRPPVAAAAARTSSPAARRRARPRAAAGCGAAAGLTALLLAAGAMAQSLPPPDVKPLVTHPTDTLGKPNAERLLDGTSLTLSAGGLFSSGNSRLLALTTNGAFDIRFDNNGIGASLLANYGRGAAPGDPIEVTNENVQGRLRYDRFVSDRASFFVINTARHDRLQGRDLRYNLDPGFKLLFLTAAAHSLWGEAGYDFQYDILQQSARALLDAHGTPLRDPATGAPMLLPTNAHDSSARLFAGFRHAFNHAVTLALGAEYLQSLTRGTHVRVNLDGLVAAEFGYGLAFGLGVSGRFDNAPLPGKQGWDTSTTASLIYALSTAKQS